MSNNTELIDKESLDKIVADIKAVLKRTSLDALNSVQWEFNQRYLFGNDADKPLIKAGKLFTKEGPVAKGAIWTSLDTGKLWMNTGSGWKNIGGLNNINKPDLIEIFHPRTDYPVETPYTTTNAGGEFWVPFKFKKYEKYSITKGQCPFTGFLTRTSGSRTDIAQDVRTSFSSGPGTYEFICMVDDAKYFYFTTGSSSNTTDLTLTDLGSAIEPVKISNMTETSRFVTFPIEKGKRYYYTKTAKSFYIGYGKGSKSVQNPDNRLKQVNNSGDSGAGTWSFVAEHDADWLYLFIGPDAVLESFEFRGEDLPDYKLTYPYVTRSVNDKPENPKVGDMIFDAAGTLCPLWWNGAYWVQSNGSTEHYQIYSSNNHSVGASSYATGYSLTTSENGGTIYGESLYFLHNTSPEYIDSCYAQRTRFCSSLEQNRYAPTVKVMVEYVKAKTSELAQAQVISFSNYSGETLTAEDKPKIIVTYSYGVNSILDFSNITKENGKEIELMITCGNTLRIKDGNTNTDLNGCNESVVKCICLNNQWIFFKTSGITQITSAQ